MSCWKGRVDRLRKCRECRTREYEYTRGELLWEGYDAGSLFHRLQSGTSKHQERGVRNAAYGDNFGTDERESSVVEDGPPPEEPSLGAGYSLVLNERTGVLPVAEPDSIVIGTTSKVDDNAQYDETGNCEYLDGTKKCVGKREKKQMVTTHAKQNSASP